MKATKIIDEITYTEKGGIFYPNLRLPEQAPIKIGKYGQMRLDFLKKYRKGTYVSLLTQGTLTAHLVSLDAAARDMAKNLTAELASKRGIDESFKATDPLCWIQEMNNCKASAEEIVFQELIYQ